MNVNEKLVNKIYEFYEKNKVLPNFLVISQSELEKLGSQEKVLFGRRLRVILGKTDEQMKLGHVIAEKDVLDEMIWI